MGIHDLTTLVLMNFPKLIRLSDPGWLEWFGCKQGWGSANQPKKNPPSNCSQVSAALNFGIEIRAGRGKDFA